MFKTVDREIKTLREHFYAHTHNSENKHPKQA